MEERGEGERDGGGGERERRAETGHEERGEGERGSNVSLQLVRICIHYYNYN